MVAINNVGQVKDVLRRCGSELARFGDMVGDFVYSARGFEASGNFGMALEYWEFAEEGLKNYGDNVVNSPDFKGNRYAHFEIINEVEGIIRNEIAFIKDKQTKTAQTV
ncbi:MAG: hypothetical protein ABIH92_05975 [Nanoarchaeota archaeon]